MIRIDLIKELNRRVAKGQKCKHKCRIELLSDGQVHIESANMKDRRSTYLLFCFLKKERYRLEDSDISNPPKSNLASILQKSPAGLFSYFRLTLIEVTGSNLSESNSETFEIFEMVRHCL